MTDDECDIHGDDEMTWLPDPRGGWTFHCVLCLEGWLSAKSR